MLLTIEPTTPTEQDARYASEGNRVLEQLMRQTEILHLSTGGTEAKEITLPANLARLISDVLACIARGQSVAVLPLQAELTTSQAADMLGISRPYLVKLLENGEIAFRQVGTKRRIPVSDLIRYREENKTKRLNTLADLQAMAQELDMGY